MLCTRCSSAISGKPVYCSQCGQKLEYAENNGSRDSESTDRSKTEASSSAKTSKSTLKDNPLSVGAIALGLLSLAISWFVPLIICLVINIFAVRRLIRAKTRSESRGLIRIGYVLNYILASAFTIYICISVYNMMVNSTN